MSENQRTSNVATFVTGRKVNILDSTIHITPVGRPTTLTNRGRIQATATTTGRDSEMQTEVTQLSESVFIFPNRKISDHGNIFEGEIRSGVYGVRVCAIKIDRKSERIVREARILSKINSHTHVISIIESGIWKNMFEERVFIALDKCHKQNLHMHITRQKESGVEYNLCEALEHCKQIIAGLTYVHENLVIHKDLHPSNILFSHDKSTIKIADFGSSQEIKSTSSKIYIKHQFGTNGYRPVESFGNNWVSLKSDIFSLGVVLCFVLSGGKSPFGDELSLWNHNIQNGTTDLSHLLVSTSKLFEHLIKSMLSKERCHRPSIWQVADHPCWTGNELEWNFDYDFTEEIDDSDFKIREECDQNSSDTGSESELESRRQLLTALEEMRFDPTRKRKNVNRTRKRKNVKGGSAIPHETLSFEVTGETPVSATPLIGQERDRIQPEVQTNRGRIQITATTGGDSKMQTATFVRDIGPPLNIKDSTINIRAAGHPILTNRSRIQATATTTGRDSEMQTDLMWLSDGKIAFYRRQPLSKTTKTVFRGRQQFLPESWREVAIKVVKCENETKLDELKLLQKLTHPNIVQLFDAGIHHAGLYDLAYIVMELCSETLATYVGKNPFKFQKFFPFVIQIVEGLDYLHTNQVIHRDLKPDNILFSQSKKVVKLADFGLSKEIPMGLSSATVSCLGAGTEGYRAPETYQSVYRVCHSIDIFPLGLVVHFIFTNGKHPYGTNPHECSLNIMNNRNPDFRQIPQFKESYADKREQLLELLIQTLQHDPDDRPTIKEIKQSAFITGHYGGSTKDARSQIRTSPDERHHKQALSSASGSVIQASIPEDLSLTSVPVSSLASLPIDSVSRSTGSATTININEFHNHDHRRTVAETVNLGRMSATYQDHTSSVTANQTSPQGENPHS